MVGTTATMMGIKLWLARQSSLQDPKKRRALLVKVVRALSLPGTASTFMARAGTAHE